MSVEAMAWAFGAPIGGNAKVVLLGLANHAHADGSRAFPGVSRLAGYACVSERTVQRALRQLEEAGLVSVMGVSGAGTTVYQLALGGGDNLAPGDTGDGEGVTSVSPEPSKEPSASSPDGEEERESGSSPMTEVVGFAQWLGFHCELAVPVQQVPRAGTARRRSLHGTFKALVAEGHELEDFRLASRGVLGDAWMVENGHVTPESVLRKTRFGKWVEKGRAAPAPGSGKYDGIEGGEIR